MKGFWGDTVRLYWAALYWNIRKTLFRVRGAEGRCPCQHASDSGRAGESACVAITHWNDPGRFRRVCPLLKKRPDGLWRCSVDTRDVRPFWARAGLLYGSTVAVIVLTALITALAGLRAIGYKVEARQVFWPPAWSELSLVRSNYFVEQADASTAAGDIKGALLALQNAYELSPANYAAGLRLARLWQANQTQRSDAVYDRLMRDHPDHRAETARLWLRAMLARGDFVGSRSLAAERILNEPDAGAAWLHALVFCCERLGDFSILDKLLAEPALPANAAAWLRFVRDTRALAPAGERAAVLERIGAATPDAYALRYAGRRLIALGHPEDTLALALRKDLAHLPARERLLLQLDALCALKREPDRVRIIEQILKSAPGDAAIEMLSAHLIRNPSASLANSVHAWARDADGLRYESRLALYCAAGAAGDADLLSRAADDLRNAGGGKFATLDAVNKFFLQKTSGGHIEAVLPILQPLPLEIVYTLLEHNPRGT